MSVATFRSMSDAIRNGSEQCLVLSRDYIDLVQNLKTDTGIHVDVSQDITDDGRSIKDIILYLESGLSLLANSEYLDEDNLRILPFPQMRNLNKHLQRLIGVLESEVYFFEKSNEPGFHLEWDGTIASLISESETQQSNLKEQITSVSNASDVLINQIYSLIGSDKFGTQGKIKLDFSKFDKTISRISDLQNEISKLSSNSIEILQKIESRNKENAKNSAEFDRQLANLNDLSESSKKMSEVISEKYANVEVVSDNFRSLRANYQEFSGDLEKFKNSLSERNKNFDEYQNKADLLFQDFESQHASVDEIIQKAETMLSGATNSGLAKAYSDLTSRVSGELRSASKVFYFSIFIFFLSTTPIILYIFFPNTSIDMKEGVGFFHFVGEVFMRALLLIPAAWLTQFAAKRHAVLFRLKEHYSHKFSMAASVDGFKLQAPSYEDEIAAATFSELVKNAATNMELGDNSDKAPNPILNFLLEKIRSRLEK